MAKKNIVKEMINNKIDYINLQFSDIMGMAKSVTIPMSKFQDALDFGLWFDGSSVEGFTRIFESDMLLKPDMNTIAVIPWLSDDKSKIARVICDVYTPDGKPYEGDPRYILKKALKEAEDMGYEFNTGPELEFFLFKMENGEVKTNGGYALETHDKGQYFDLVLDLGYDVRREMIDALQAMGIEVETSHHEVAPGQHEIDFKYGDALTTADRVMTLKYTLKAIAQKHGLYATFMPKPITGVNGNGMHVHQSLFSKKTGDNIFFKKSDKYKLSKLAYQFMAGQLENVKAMAALLNPTVNSYKRLVPGYEASTYICWAQINRSALIRVPRYSPGKEKSTRMEIRCPDPSANPYLAFAVLLKAGLHGIKNKLVPPAPVEEDVFEFDEQKLDSRHIEFLPYSLWRALKALEKNDIMRELLGDEFIIKYSYAKKAEWDDYRIQVSQWELDRYLYLM